MNEFYNIGKDLTDKISYHRYDRFYPLFLNSFRNEEFNMLEVGIENGGSLKLWKEYFPKSFIYGVDIKKEYEEDRCKIFKLDQSNDNDIQYMIHNIPKCKFIIDDGSHHPYHQYITFVSLFDKLLEDGGVYIVEDIECNYWKHNSTVYGYEIGFFNFVDWVKGKIDSVNEEFTFFKNELNISMITFAHNCIIFTKKTTEEIKLMDREYRFKNSLKNGN